MQGDGLIHRLRHGGRANMIHAVGAGSTASPYLSAFVKLSPVILPASTGITVRLAECARSNAWVSFDGRDRQELLPGLVQRFSRMLPTGMCARCRKALPSSTRLLTSRLLQLLVPVPLPQFAANAAGLIEFDCFGSVGG
uniref:Secreted protein n=1 Tax=Macrostomum lignano TaxID=282301 RepID=A0A1I8FMJ3_9PLAT